MTNMQAHTGCFPLVNLRTNYKSTNNQPNKKSRSVKLFLKRLFFHVVSTILVSKFIVFYIPGSVILFIYSEY
jgi:hypothetical protein